MPRLLPLLACVPLLSFSAACAGESDGHPGPADVAVVPEVCTETNPTEARIAFDEGEVSALAPVDGEILVGARSIRVDEAGAVWSVAFDGRPTRMVSTGYVTGSIHVSEGFVVHSEPTAEANRARLVVSAIDGSERRVVDGPDVLVGADTELVRGRVFYFGDDGTKPALFSYDPRDRAAKVVRVADDSAGGALFSNGDTLFRFAAKDDRLVAISRLDPASSAFSEVTTFEAHARTVAGSDARSFFLRDVVAGAIVPVDIATGKEGAPLGHGFELEGSPNGMHVTEDAIYGVESKAPRLVRVDKKTGAQTTIAELPPQYVHVFASDACYLYAGLDGGRTIARYPRARR